jgi:hypothetical protein
LLKLKPLKEPKSLLVKFTGLAIDVTGKFDELYLGGISAVLFVCV